MELEKKSYSTPQLTVHGSVDQITLIGGFVSPKDTPQGLPNSAFPS
ncbi:MAG TPA: lasso peptide [Blastocatellia bacterium]|nr:lasso peptide [Blastocatellia bacterium]